MKVAPFTTAGLLVPDSLIVELVAHVLKKEPCVSKVSYLLMIFLGNVIYHARAGYWMASLALLNKPKR